MRCRLYTDNTAYHLCRAQSSLLLLIRRHTLRPQKSKDIAIGSTLTTCLWDDRHGFHVRNSTSPWAPYLSWRYAEAKGDRDASYGEKRRAEAAGKRLNLPPAPPPLNGPFVLKRK